ncbi:hypothetical protein ACXWOD_11350, partial [Streptococcus pyogenes]
EYFNIIANGTAKHSDTPIYDQQMNILRYRVEAAEKKAASLEEFITSRKLTELYQEYLKHKESNP